MVPNWPDAIVCSGSTGKTVFNFAWISGAAANYSLAGDYGDAGTNSPRINFATVSAAGVLTETGSWPNWATDCSGKTLGQLYAAGQAYNFIGSAALGDRITSGTTNVIANAASSYVSLTIGVTTWGYFGATNSYLPELT